MGSGQARSGVRQRAPRVARDCGQRLSRRECASRCSTSGRDRRGQRGRPAPSAKTPGASTAQARAIARSFERFEHASCGRRSAATAGSCAVEARAQPVPRHVERGRPADPEVRPEQRAGDARGDRPSMRRSSRAGSATPDRARVDGVAGVASRTQRRQRRRGRDDGMAERARDAVAPAVAAGLGQRQAAGREDHRARRQRALATSRPETRRRRARREHARGRRGARRRRVRSFAQQRVEDVARSVAVRETACRPALRAAGRRCSRKNATVVGDAETRAGRAGSIGGRPPLKSRLGDDRCW